MFVCESNFEMLNGVADSILLENALEGFCLRVRGDAETLADGEVGSAEEVRHEVCAYLWHCEEESQAFDMIFRGVARITGSVTGTAHIEVKARDIVGHVL